MLNDYCGSQFYQPSWYNNGLLPLIRQFFLIPNAINVFMDPTTLSVSRLYTVYSVDYKMFNGCAVVVPLRTGSGKRKCPEKISPNASLPDFGPFVSPAVSSLYLPA
jgi:hypothetical protein